MTIDSDPIPVLSTAAVRRFGHQRAADAIRAALAAGLDPARTPPRAVVPVSAGELLLMSAEAAGYVGVKIAAVAPDNPGSGLPRIQGMFLLMSARTLAPVALVDGIALTNLRTAAVSAAAAMILHPEPARQAVVFGSGPQAVDHVRALQATIGLRSVTISARDGGRASAVASQLALELAVPVEASGSRAQTAEALTRADLVVCATTSRDPLFTEDQIRAEALVILVGSHEVDAAEGDPALLGRAQTVVEDTDTALREAGEVTQAVAAGRISPAMLVTLADLVCGRVSVDGSRTRVFKSVGMAWEDVVVAAALWRARGETGVGM